LFEERSQRRNSNAAGGGAKQLSPIHAGDVFVKKFDCHVIFQSINTFSSSA
jgi:hypothetical protein